MLRSFAFLCRTFSSLNCAPRLNERLIVDFHKKAVLVKHLHISPLRFAETLDDGKDNEGEEDSEKEENPLVMDEQTQKEEKAALLSTLEPQKLRMKPDHRRMLVRLAIKDHKIKATGEEASGLSGAKSLLSINTAEIDRHLPTAMTLLQTFDGVPFRELPVVHIKATPNNTIIHAFNFLTKHAIIYTSCRKEGFKHTKKKSPLAGQTAGAAAGQKLLRRGVATVRVIIKGIGPGRISSVKGLVLAGVKVASISDVTPIPELGPRPKKIRRV